MSEIVNATDKMCYRWTLLITVSALALYSATYGMNEAKASDQAADQPTVWIELGGQLVHASGQGDSFPVGFLAANPDSPVLKPVSPLQAQKPESFGFAEDGKISLKPGGSDWVFAASVNYGRSGNAKHVDHQTNGTHISHTAGGGTLPGFLPQTAADFADTKVRHQESHAIVDFLVGKDVGVGLFGRESISVLSAGVRFAQFSSKASFDLRARPDLRTETHALPSRTVDFKYFHTYHLSGNSSRNFHGLGPSLSWNGSAPFLGNPQGGELTLDWGVNAAVLFGKQKSRVAHHESSHYKSNGILKYYAPGYQRSGGHGSTRSVVIPNVGGFAGATYRLENFKLSAGYRADFFFGAIDGGIDTVKRENVGFYGPFASVSIGISG